MAMIEVPVKSGALAAKWQRFRWHRQRRDVGRNPFGPCPGGHEQPWRPELRENGPLSEWAIDQELDPFFNRDLVFERREEFCEQAYVRDGDRLVISTVWRVQRPVMIIQPPYSTAESLDCGVRAVTVDMPRPHAKVGKMSPVLSGKGGSTKTLQEVG